MGFCYGLVLWYTNGFLDACVLYPASPVILETHSFVETFAELPDAPEPSGTPHTPPMTRTRSF